MVLGEMVFRHPSVAFLPPCTGGVLELRTEPIGGVDVQDAAVVCYCLHLVAKNNNHLLLLLCL